MEPKKESSRYRAAILTAIALYTALNVTWIYQDTRPPHSDSVIYIQGSFQFYERIQEEGIYGLGSFLKGLSPRPPMQSLIGAAVLPFVNWSPDGVLYVNAFWLGLAAWLIFLLGWHIGGDAAGFLSAVFFMTNPFVHGHLQQYEAEAPLLVFVTASFLVILRILEKERVRDFALLGFLIGIGLLFKWLYLIILIGPIFVCLCLYGKRSWDRYRISGRSNLLACGWNLVGLIAFPLLTALPWYLWRLETLFAFREKVANSNTFTPFTDGWTFFVLVYYPALVGLRLKIVHLALLAAGLIAVLANNRNRSHSSGKWLLRMIALSLFLFWLFFVIQYKNTPQKYLLPLQPLLAVLAGASIAIVPSSIQKKAFGAAALVLTAILIHNQWGFPRLLSPKNPPVLSGFWVEQQTPLWIYDPHPPKKCFLSHEAIARRIEETWESPQDEIRVYVLPRLPEFSYFTLSVWLSREIPRSTCVGISYSNCLTDYLFHDFLIASQGPVLDEKRSREWFRLFETNAALKLARALDSPPPSFQSSHERIERFLYRNSIPITLYKRTQPVSIQEAADSMAFFAEEIVQSNLWKQIEAIWRRLNHLPGEARIHTFFLAIRKNHAPSILRLLQSSDEEIAAWLPYERYLLAVLARKQNHADRARQLFQEIAYAKIPGSSDAAVRLAEMELDTQQTDSAIRWLFQALSLNLYNQRIPQLLAQAFERRGDEDRAKCFQILEEITEKIVFRNDRPEWFAEADRLLTDAGFSEQAQLYRNKIPPSSRMEIEDVKIEE